MYQYCLFDLDGTLTDPREGITKCVQYALHHYGIEEPDLTKLEAFIGPPLADSFMQFYGFPEQKAWEACTVYRERFIPIGAYENKVFEGVPEMLQQMKEKGIQIAIASSKPEVSVRKILEHFDLMRYFDGVQALPDEDRYSQCVMVGDRKFDICGAKMHGVTAVGVSFGFADEGELEQAGADYIVDSIEEMTDFLIRP